MNAEHDPRQADQELEQELKTLKEQYARLQTEKTKAETSLEHAQQQLSQLEDEARREFGTADVGELQTMLAKRREENARLVEDYRRHIQGVQQELEKVESGKGAGKNSDDGEDA